MEIENGIGMEKSEEPLLLILILQPLGFETVVFGCDIPLV